MGGSDDPKNLKELTVKQHARAHKKLFKQHGKWEDKIAYEMLSGQITNYEAKQEVRRLANLGNKNSVGRINPKWHNLILSKTMKESRSKHKTMGHFEEHTEKTKKKIAKKLKGNSNKLGKTGKQKNKFEGKRTWLMGENNVSKRPEVRAKLRQAALNRYSPTQN